MHLCNFYSTCKSVEEIQKLRLKAKWKVVVVSTIAYDFHDSSNTMCRLLVDAKKLISFFSIWKVVDVSNHNKILAQNPTAAMSEIRQ